MFSTTVSGLLKFCRRRWRLFTVVWIGWLGIWLLRLPISPSMAGPFSWLDGSAQWVSQGWVRGAIAQINPRPVSSGSQIRLNGRLLPAAWERRGEQVGVADVALASTWGIDLRNTADPQQQPIDWFSVPATPPTILPAWQTQNTRYLDISALLKRFNWQVQPQGSVLALLPQPATMTAIRQGQQTWGERLTIDLSQPVTWQIDKTANQVTITIDANVSAELAAQLANLTVVPGQWLQQLTVTPQAQRIVLTATTKGEVTPYAWSLADPYRLILDFRADSLQPREIQWAKGLQWQQRYVALGNDQFPVYALMVTPSPQTVLPLPIKANATGVPGIAPLLTMAQQRQAAAAINGGFFNRNNQLPLGALRYNQQWLSGPILGRGAIAWDNTGQLLMGRLALNQTITTDSGKTLPVLYLNSGYVQAGISLYDPAWGATYTPLIDNEVVVTVRQQQVHNQQTLTRAGEGTVSIPPDGYLLALRAYATAAPLLTPGTRLIYSAQTQPAGFQGFPHILGAGPLLVEQGQIVLDALAEGFSQNFITGAAPRSVLGRMADGRWQIVAIHERIGGRGPTLTETAQIMQRLGCIDALNLDGGSSTSLYLNGRLLNRPPQTAARVHNGLGLFLAGSS